jgi:hypothetical protein
MFNDRAKYPIEITFPRSHRMDLKRFRHRRGLQESVCDTKRKVLLWISAWVAGIDAQLAGIQVKESRAQGRNVIRRICAEDGILAVSFVAQQG